MDKLKVNNQINQTIINEIVLFLKQIKYGEVIVTVHNSRVVQIEKREKKRF